MRTRWESLKIGFGFEISKQFRIQTLDFQAATAAASGAPTAAGVDASATITGSHFAVHRL